MEGRRGERVGGGRMGGDGRGWEGLRAGGAGIGGQKRRVEGKGAKRRRGTGGQCSAWIAGGGWRWLGLRVLAVRMDGGSGWFEDVFFGACGVGVHFHIHRPSKCSEQRDSIMRDCSPTTPAANKPRPHSKREEPWGRKGAACPSSAGRHAL